MFQRYFYIIRNENPHIETDLATIAQLAEQNQEANDQFITYLNKKDGPKLDHQVQALNEKLSKEIDCTRCGNCCKSLLIVVTDQEADRLSKALHSDRTSFDARYLEKGSNGMMLINQIPCVFLEDNKCTVYPNRFEGCREFPALHLDGFNKRLFTHFMHYGRCPIIFNVMELLKKEYQFN